MTPSQQAKAAGLKSLRQVAQITGKPERTLYDWNNSHPELLRAVILGCAEILKTEAES